MVSSITLKNLIIGYRSKHQLRAIASPVHASLQAGELTCLIGAIVGSIAEARFGIPQEIKDRAMEYLPDEMQDVLKQFAGKYEIKPK